MRHFLERKTFWRYLFSYLLIFAIPFVLSFVFFRVYFVKTYREEIILNHTQQSSQVGRNLDWQLKQLNNLISQVQLSDIFRSGQAGKPTHQIVMCQQLHMLQSTNKFIFALNYYQRGIEQIVSSSVVMKRESVSRIHFRYENWPQEQMLADINALHSTVWRPFEPMVSLNRERKEILTMLAPLTSAALQNASVLQIQIERKTFEELLGLSPDSASTFLILDSQGTPFYSSSELTHELREAVAMLWTQGLPNQAVREMGSFLAYGGDSEADGWYYLNLLPMKQVMQKADTIQIIYLIFAGAILLVCLLVIFLISKVNYKPIKQLQEAMEEFRIPVGQADDEIEKARTAISYLHEFSFDLKKKLEKSSQHVQEGLIRSLMQGEYQSLQDFNEDASPYGLCYQSLFLFVVVVSGGEPQGPLTSSQLEGVFQKICEAHGIHIFDGAHSVYVCGIDRSGQQEIFEKFRQAADWLREEKKTALQFGISTLTADVSTLYSKYVEAVSALEYMHAENEPVSLYGMESKKYSIRYPSEEIETLRQFVEIGDEKRFLVVFQNLLSYVENLDVSLFMRICVCYDVINALLKILLNLAGDGIAQNFLEENSLSFVGQSNEYSRYIEIMCGLRDEVLTILHKIDVEDELLERIKAYISLHYLDRDFGVQRVADEFSMSLPNMSAYFKGKTETCLLTYITSFKMNYAMELLKSTDLPLTTIGEKTGYATPSSFIRKFKQYTGITPGEFKKIHETTSRKEL